MIYPIYLVIYQQTTYHKNVTDAVLMSTLLAYPFFKISKFNIKNITGGTIFSHEFQYMSIT